MRTETYEQRILIPDAGHWMLNRKGKVISDKVYLGIHADVAEWEEITDAEKLKLEAEWDAEREAEMAQA